MPGKPPSLYGDGFAEKIKAFDRACLWFIIGAAFGGAVMALLSRLSHG